MPHDTLTASLVLFNGEMQQPHPVSSSREIDESAVTFSVRPENTSEELLVGRDGPPAGEAPALAGGPSQWVLSSNGPFMDPQGAAAPLDVFYNVQYKTAHVASLLPRRIVGSSPDTWGKEGDECVICLGTMAAGEEVSDLPACYHTFHLQCAADWLKTRVEAGKPGCCPVCNAVIFIPVLTCTTPAISTLLNEPRLNEPPLESCSSCARCFAIIVFIFVIVAVTGLCMQNVPHEK
jgi:hypothetical protein